MTVDAVSRSRDAKRPRFSINVSLKREGAGNAGCLLHPRSRVQWHKEVAHEHTGTAGALRHSLRNGLTAYAALSLETNSSCLHRCRLDGSFDPVGSNLPPAAWHQPRVSGPHGFAVRCNAGHLARRAHSREIPPCEHASRLTLPASTASRPAFVTTRDPPSCRDGTARKEPLIWVGWKAEYFCARDWTAFR
jgi:hypothetical protein